MTLASSTLQIRKHGYSGDLNIVICVGICTLPFYAINMDDRWLEIETGPPPPLIL
ncbi:transmembrane protein, putative [Medicago truncatula]|uniref:Transmembrane protein, putative n=1 Tax=Medicago truncatula TaxID=3880 RepID=G7L561_MEDTR|nr:transmembrane protein, putative [Medicago truncatula]